MNSESDVAGIDSERISTIDRDRIKMLQFFQEVGLGYELSERVATRATERGIYSPEKLKLMIDRAALNLQDDLQMDQFDADLLLRGINNPKPRPTAGGNKTNQRTPARSSQTRSSANSNQMTSPSSNTTETPLLPQSDALSPGFEIDIFEAAANNFPLCLFACYFPCVPLAAAMASLQDRQASFADFLCAPNLFQVRQAFRYRFLRPDNPSGDPNEWCGEDCFASWCCTSCGITQVVIEISKKTGNEPTFF